MESNILKIPSVFYVVKVLLYLNVFEVYFPEND